MRTNTYVCSACTTGSIAELGEHKNAKAAMLAFLKQTMSPYEGSFKKSGSSRVYTLLDAFWVFTAGPEEPGHGHSKDWVKYGTEFAQYIIDEKLGEVATLPAKLNTKYHPDTTCQTWLWSPDQKACEAWMDKHWKEPKKVTVAARKGKSQRPENPDYNDICPRCDESWEDHSGWECEDGGEWPE